MRSFLLILSVFICCIVSFSKIPVPKDSLHILSDTLRTDSAHVNRDTTKVKGVDTVVTYLCSDSIVYDLSTKLMTMFHKSQIKYQQMQLNSERITVNWNTSILTAQGIPDSPAVGRAGSPTKDKAGSSDSTKKKKYKGLPVMNPGTL